CRLVRTRVARIGGGTTATGTVMVPPSADVTVTESGGGLPGGRPTAALALPLPVEVSSLGTKPAPLAVRAGLAPTSLVCAATTRSGPRVKIALGTVTRSPSVLNVEAVGGMSLMLLTVHDVGVPASGPRTTRPKKVPVVPISVIDAGSEPATVACSDMPLS